MLTVDFMTQGSLPKIMCGLLYLDLINKCLSVTTLLMLYTLSLMAPGGEKSHLYADNQSIYFFKQSICIFGFNNVKF